MNYCALIAWKRCNVSGEDATRNKFPNGTENVAIHTLSPGPSKNPPSCLSDSTLGVCERQLLRDGRWAISSLPHLLRVPYVPSNQAYLEELKSIVAVLLPGYNWTALTIKTDIQREQVTDGLRLSTLLRFLVWYIRR